ncbi:MAG: dihydropteroate synthase [Gammaproteobacteria bacterium]|nr:dihydropteroate synthase [Gammaproteobacteria bacterium]
MAIYLGLGSNLGERRGNLRRALEALGRESIAVARVSPTVETPALLAEDAPADWNLPFLNLVVECTTSLDPNALLDALQRIERELGRGDHPRWAPRTIDIDILLYGDEVVESAALTIPHAELQNRSFVLSPLAALAPNLRIPGTDVSVIGALRRKRLTIPLWMGIVNVTPDSFSDGGRYEQWPGAETAIDTMIAAGAQILDFGAESTRPGATPMTADEEWARLEPILSATIDKLAADALRPLISVDTYHADVARKALALGIDWINDVGGLTDPDMLELAANSDATFVAMHNLGLPADPAKTLPTDRSAVDQVDDWLDDRIASWQREGIALDRILFDPGIGFGKNPLQSQQLLQHVGRFLQRELRVLVGHSRKSFLKGLSGDSLHERDLVTVGSSMVLARAGVDVIRVHNVADHAAAYRGFTHTVSSRR